MATDFKSTFAAARKAGKKVFTWNGKSYNTKLKEEVSKPSTGPKPRPTPIGPRPRPAAGKGSPATTTSPAVPPFTTMEKKPDSRPANAIQKGNREQRREREAARNARRAASEASAKAKSDKVKTIRAQAERLDAMSKARDIKR